MKALTMFDRYEITSLTVNRAVNKLARAGIEVFNVRKTGKTRIRLSIRAKDSEKFFAIFHGSCYTINKLKDRGLKRLAVWALCRVGVLVGIVRREVAAIAKAVLECEISYEYESKEESDKALADAYAAATLEIGDAEILEKSADVRAENGAFVYEIHIRYAATFAVNMD